MNGTYSRVVFAQELMEQTAFERVFDLGFTEFVQPAKQRAKTQLNNDEKHRIECTAPEKRIILPHGRVHDGAQQQGIKNP